MLFYYNYQILFMFPFFYKFCEKTTNWRILVVAVSDDAIIKTACYQLSKLWQTYSKHVMFETKLFKVSQNL